MWICCETSDDVELGFYDIKFLTLPSFGLSLAVDGINRSSDGLLLRFIFRRY